MNEEKDRKSNGMNEWMDSIKIQSPVPDKDHSAEKSFSRLMARIHADNNSVDIFRRRANRYRIGLVAATVALLVTMSGWLLTTQENELSFVVASNNGNVVKDISLSDGTVIKLNNHSKLIYPESFSSTRGVFLEGEAYFEVAHDKKHPFIVRVGDLKIKVLGTKFTVNSNPQTSTITTSLLEGSIDIIGEKGHVLMKPNQQLTYDINNKEMQLTNITNADQEIRWTQNIWVLSNTPLLDICKRLETQFNVKFIIMNDKLIEKYFTGEFYTNESIESILEIMQISTSFTYERKGNNIILR